MPILNDADAEGDETFSVSLSGLSGAAGTVVITDTATVTIADDDIPNVRLADVTVGEEDGTVTVTATLDIARSPGGFTVDRLDCGRQHKWSDLRGWTTPRSASLTLTFAGMAGETRDGRR